MISCLDANGFVKAMEQFVDVVEREQVILLIFICNILVILIILIHLKVKWLTLLLHNVFLITCFHLGCVSSGGEGPRRASRLLYQREKGKNRNHG